MGFSGSFTPPSGCVCAWHTCSVHSKLVWHFQSVQDWHNTSTYVSIEHVSKQKEENCEMGGGWGEEDEQQQQQGRGGRY